MTLPELEPILPLTHVMSMNYRWTARAWPHRNVARVEVYVSPTGHEAVCVLIDGRFNHGTSTVNGAEALVGLLSSGPLVSAAPDAAVRFLDAQVNSCTGEESPQYSWVTFGDDVRFSAPKWRYAPHAEIGALIGQSAWRRHRNALMTLSGKRGSSV